MSTSFATTTTPAALSIKELQATIKQMADLTLTVAFDATKSALLSPDGLSNSSHTCATLRVNTNRLPGGTRAVNTDESYPLYLQRVGIQLLDPGLLHPSHNEPIYITIVLAYSMSPSFHVVFTCKPHCTTPIYTPVYIISLYPHRIETSILAYPFSAPPVYYMHDFYFIWYQSSLCRY